MYNPSERDEAVIVVDDDVLSVTPELFFRVKESSLNPEFVLIVTEFEPIYPPLSSVPVQLYEEP